MRCPVCKTNKGVQDNVYGLLPCTPCQQKRRQNSLPDPTEMVGESIKKERDVYAKSIVQPFNSAGEFSDEYYQVYGTKGVKVTLEQVKNRKRIWDKAISQNIDITKTK